MDCQGPSRSRQDARRSGLRALRPGRRRLFRPTVLLPAEHPSKAFLLIHDGMVASNVVAVARTVLFRRVRSVLIRSHGQGLIANTLNFDYEVRSADEAFSALPGTKADDEMLDLALHIIKKKAGRFDPTKFDDRYDAALLELVNAKMEGRKITWPKALEPTKPSDDDQGGRSSHLSWDDRHRGYGRHIGASRRREFRPTGHHADCR